MIKASFQGSLELTDYYVEIISSDNEKQIGDYLNAFIDLINKSKDKIKKLVIIDTSFLHRHYDVKYSNESNKTSWLKENEKYLEKISMPFFYISYSQIVKSRFYDPHYKCVKIDYTGDESGNNIDEKFRSIVKTVSDQFIHKGTLKDNVKFLLDETAGYPALIEFLEEKLISETEREKISSPEVKIDPSKLKITLSYPGGFNQCILYSMEKRKLSTKIKVEEISYRFRGSRELKLEAKFGKGDQKEIYPKSDNGIYSPTFFSRSIAYHIDLMEIEPKHQPSLSVKMIGLLQDFKKEIDTNGTKYKNI